MIFLKWEEPVEPNGLITQYEVCRKIILGKWILCLFSPYLAYPSANVRKKGPVNALIDIFYGDEQ